MAIDKELFYASHGLKYPVVARQYTDDDIIVKEKIYTKDEVIAMFTELQAKLGEEKQDIKHLHYDDLENAESYNNGIDNCIDTIQQKISKLKEEDENGN